MSPPVLKAQSPFAVSFGSTLKVQTPSASPGDLVLLWVEGISWFSTNAGSPSTPQHFRVLHEFEAVTGFKKLMWAKVPDSGLSSVILTADPGQSLSGGWWGEAAVFGNVAYKQKGFVNIPGSAGDYVITNRADVAAFTTISVMVRVEFDVIDVANNFFYGWEGGDLGFRLDATNRPIFYVQNTLGAPIGNVVANASIPGFATGRKIWLRADLNTTTATVTYYYSLDESDDFGSAFRHMTQLGTPVVGTNAGTTPRVANSENVYFGTRDAATTPFNGKVFYGIEWTNAGGLTFTYLLDLNGALPPGSSIAGGGDAVHYRPTGEDFPSFPFDDWQVCDTFCYLDPQDIYIPERHVQGSDRLAFHVFRGGKFGGPHINDPISGPVDWDVRSDRATNALGLYLKYITRLKEVDASTTDVDVVASSGYGYLYYAVVIRGHSDPPVQPAAPTPPRLSLNCADSYTAFFTEGDYRTRIDAAQWETLNWGRVLDDISTAGGRFPDELGGVNCLAKHGGLMAWKHGLLIERNDQEVWSGPITSVRREGDAMVVAAADVLARYRKRLAVRDALVTYSQADAGLIFHDIITTHASLIQDLWAIEVPEINTNVPVDRVLKPREFKYAWDLLSELLNSAVDAFVLNGVLYLFEPGTGWVYQDAYKRTVPLSYNVNYDAVFGMFTEQSWSSRPNWGLDGGAQGNFVVAPTADSGEYGFRTYAVTEVPESQLEFGILDYVDVDPLEVPTDQEPSLVARALRARANSLAALRGFAPVSIEGGTLAEGAPIDINNLLPGSIWLMDIFDAGYGQLLAASRLKKVAVSVKRERGNAITETISPTLEPPGWLGGLDDG